MLDEVELTFLGRAEGFDEMETGAHRPGVGGVKGLPGFGDLDLVAKRLATQKRKFGKLELAHDLKARQSALGRQRAGPFEHICGALAVALRRMPGRSDAAHPEKDIRDAVIGDEVERAGNAVRKALQAPELVTHVELEGGEQLRGKSAARFACARRLDEMRGPANVAALKGGQDFRRDQPAGRILLARHAVHRLGLGNHLLHLIEAVFARLEEGETRQGGALADDIGSAIGLDPVVAQGFAEGKVILRRRADGTHQRHPAAIGLRAGQRNFGELIQQTLGVLALLRKEQRPGRAQPDYGVVPQFAFGDQRQPFAQGLDFALPEDEVENDVLAEAEGPAVIARPQGEAHGLRIFTPPPVPEGKPLENVRRRARTSRHHAVLEKPAQNGMN